MAALLSVSLGHGKLVVFIAQSGSRKTAFTYVICTCMLLLSSSHFWPSFSQGIGSLVCCQRSQCLQQFLWAQILHSYISIAWGSLVCVQRKKEKKTLTISNAFYYLFKQITWTSAHCSRAGDMQPAEVQQESIVSYLPLSHIAAQIYDLWTGIKWGEQVYFAEPDALKVSVLYCT